MLAKESVILILSMILILVGVFYIATIRQGHDWGDDFSMYIHHAKNISEGIKYDQTGYVYNPSYSNPGPKTFPPIFPLLLSPIYRFFGINFTAMKIEIILFFLLSLLAVFYVFRGAFSSNFTVLLLIAILGFNPYFWSFKENIISDIPALFFIYLSIIVVSKIYGSRLFNKNQTQNAIWLGILFYLCYGTRTLNLVLLPSFFIYDFIIHKKITLFPVKVTLIFGFLVLLQNVFFGSCSGYLEGLRISPSSIFSNILYYAKELSIFWENGYSKIIGYALFIFVNIAALIGFFISIKKKASFWMIFVVFYIIAIIICPWSAGTRYLIPIIPVYLYYILAGVDYINQSRSKFKINFVFILLISTILATYISKYSTLDWGPIKEGVTDKESVELFNYIKENTGKEDIFIFRKPKALALFTERKASAYHTPAEYEQLWKYFQNIGASHIIISPLFNDAYLSGFIERYIKQLQKIYSNKDFILYRIIK